MMLRNLKPALISAVVVVILSGLLMGVRLSQQGTSLVLVGGGTDVWLKIAAAALFLFLFNLFRDHLTRLWRKVPALPRTPAAFSILAAQPVVHRLLWCFLIAASLIWPMNTAERRVKMNACRNATKISSIMIATAIRNGAPEITLRKVKMSPMMASTMMCPAVMLAKSRMASANGLVSFPMISTGVMTSVMGS